MATASTDGTREAPRGALGTLPDIGDIPDRAKEAAKVILGPAVVESLKPAFDPDEEDTKVTNRVLQNTRAEIEKLCREFLEDE